MTRRWWQQAVLVFGVCWMASASLMAAPIWFGWWNTGGDGQDPVSAVDQIAEDTGFTSVTMAVSHGDEAGWREAARWKQKVILRWPSVLYDAVDVDRPLPLELAAPWVEAVRAHVGQILAISVVDEPEMHSASCRADLQVVTDCRPVVGKLEANLRAVRAVAPGLPVWVNFSAPYVGIFRDGRAEAVGASLSSAEWVSMDCYWSWDGCLYGATPAVPVASVPDVITTMKRWLHPTQRIVLIPPAFVGWSLTPSVVVDLAYRYAAYAKTDSRVVAVLPFIRWSLPGWWRGAVDVPEVYAAYRGIGRDLTAKPMAAPTGVRVVREP